MFNRFKMLITVFLLMLLSNDSAFSEKPPEGEGRHFLTKEKILIDGTDLTLLPDFNGKDDFLRELRASDPEKCLEMLFTMPLPDVERKDLFLFLFNKINQLSSMSGLYYYSHNAGGMTLYLEDCYLVEKKGSRKPLPNLNYNTLPREDSFVIYQKDTSFGSNWYQVKTRVTDEVIILSMTNINTMRYFLFPIMGEGGIKIDLIIIPEEKALKLYALSQMEVTFREILGKKIYLPGVFDHRMSAIQAWFAGQIYDIPYPGQLPEGWKPSL